MCRFSTVHSTGPLAMKIETIVETPEDADDTFLVVTCFNQITPNRQ